MLVLSRQKNQKVNFPSLGISVEILDIKGSKVRVGVDAPIEVRVLRDELPDRGPSEKNQPHVVRLPASLRHELRNALHELSLMLHVYRKRIEKLGAADVAEPIEAERLFQAIVDRLENLGSHDAFSSPDSPARENRKQRAESADGVALVVDDDDNERELLAGFLRMCGYRVATACDGADAIEWLEQNAAPRFVLLDMAMPRCDGAEFLRRVREESRWDDVHVFVVSGSQPEDHDLPKAAPRSEWFSKPLDPRRLVARLSNVA